MEEQTLFHMVVGPEDAIKVESGANGASITIYGLAYSTRKARLADLNAIEALAQALSGYAQAERQAERQAAQGNDNANS